MGILSKLGFRKKKSYVFAAEPERLVPDLGGCIVTDGISVEGGVIGRMERGDPINDIDSGWVFTTGDEEPDPKRATIFDVNTIANYDPEIVGFLTYPPGTVVERNDGRFTVVSGSSTPPSVQFLPPVRPGPLRVLDRIELTIPRHMLRRKEEGQIVIWRPGLTIYLDVSRLWEGETADDLVAEIRDRASADRTDECLEDRDDVTRFSYRLEERRPDGTTQPTVSAVAIDGRDRLLFAFYFDDADSEADARAIWDSLRPAPAN